MCWLLDPEYEEGMSAGDGDVLLVAGEVRHRARSDRAAGLKLPQRLAAPGVERVEVAFVRSAEHESAGGCHHASPRRRRQLEVPRLLAGLHIERTDGTPRFLVEPLLAAAGVVGPRFVLDAGSGKPLWQFQTGGAIRSGPMSFQAGDKQYVAVAGGHALFVFALE